MSSTINTAIPSTTQAQAQATNHGSGDKHDLEFFTEFSDSKVPPVFNLRSQLHPTPHDGSLPRLIVKADIYDLRQFYDRLRAQSRTPVPAHVHLPCCDKPDTETTCGSIRLAAQQSFEVFAARFPVGIRPFFTVIPLDPAKRASEASRWALSELTVDLKPNFVEAVHDQPSRWTNDIPFCHELHVGDAMYSVLEGREEHISLSHGLVDEVWARKEVRLLEAKAAVDGELSPAELLRKRDLEQMIITTVAAYRELHEPQFEYNGEAFPYTVLLTKIDAMGNGKGTDSTNTGPTVRQVGGGPIFASKVFSNQVAFEERFPKQERGTDALAKLWDHFCDFNGAHLARIGYVTHVCNQSMMMDYEVRFAEIMAHGHGRKSHGHVLNTSNSTTQTNHTKVEPAPWSAGYLSRRLGINFGVNHCDLGDALDQYTSMWNGLRMPRDSFGGVFFHIPTGSYVTIDPTRRSVFCFHGNTNHVGTSPATAPNCSEPLDPNGFPWWRWAEVCYPTSRAASQDGPVILDHETFLRDPVCRASRIGHNEKMPPIPAEGHGASCFGTPDTLAYNLAVATLRRTYRIDVIDNAARMVRAGELESTLSPHAQFLASVDNLDALEPQGPSYWEQTARQIARRQRLGQTPETAHLVDRLVGPWAPWGGGTPEQVERHRRDKAHAEEIHAVLLAAHVPSQSFVHNRDAVIRSRGWERNWNSKKWGRSLDEVPPPLLPTRYMAELEWPHSADYVSDGVHGARMDELWARWTLDAADIHDYQGPRNSRKRHAAEVFDDLAYHPGQDRTAPGARKPPATATATATSAAAADAAALNLGNAAPSSLHLPCSASKSKRRVSKKRVGLETDAEIERAASEAVLKKELKRRNDQEKRDQDIAAKAHEGFVKKLPPLQSATKWVALATSVFLLDTSELSSLVGALANQPACSSSPSFNSLTSFSATDDSGDARMPDAPPEVELPPPDVKPTTAQLAESLARSSRQVNPSIRDIIDSYSIAGSYAEARQSRIFTEARDSFFRFTNLAAYFRSLHTTLHPRILEAILAYRQQENHRVAAPAVLDEDKDPVEYAWRLVHDSAYATTALTIKWTTAARLLHSILGEAVDVPDSRRDSRILLLSSSEVAALNDGVSQKVPAKPSYSTRVRVSQTVAQTLEFLLARVTHYRHAGRELSDLDVWKAYELDKSLGRVANYALEAFGSPLPFLDKRITDIIEHPRILSELEGLKITGTKHISATAHQLGFWLVSRYDVITDGILALVDQIEEDPNYSDVHSILRFDSNLLSKLPLPTIDPRLDEKRIDAPVPTGVDPDAESVEPVEPSGSVRRTEEQQDVIVANRKLVAWLDKMRGEMHVGTLEAKRNGRSQVTESLLLSEEDEAIWLHGYLILGLEIHGLLEGDDLAQYESWRDGLPRDELANLLALRKVITEYPDKYDWVRSLHPIMRAMPDMRLQSLTRDQAIAEPGTRPLEVVLANLHLLRGLFNGAPEMQLLPRDGFASQADYLAWLQVHPPTHESDKAREKHFGNVAVYGAPTSLWLSQNERRFEVAALMTPEILSRINPETGRLSWEDGAKFFFNVSSKDASFPDIVKQTFVGGPLLGTLTLGDLVAWGIVDSPSVAQMQDRVLIINRGGRTALRRLRFDNMRGFKQFDFLLNNSMTGIRPSIAMTLMARGITLDPIHLENALCKTARDDMNPFRRLHIFRTMPSFLSIGIQDAFTNARRQLIIADYPAMNLKPLR